MEIDGRRKEDGLDPVDLGFKKGPLDAIRGGGPEQNARIARELLSGGDGPRRDVLLLNSAAALRAAGVVKDWKDGIRTAAEAIDTGRAGQTLARWAKISQA